MQKDIEKFLQKVEQAEKEDKLNSIRYISGDGIFINYYTFRGNNNELLKNVYFKYGNYLSQEKTPDSVRKFLNLISQIKEKLISLGAKPTSAVSKK